MTWIVMVNNGSLRSFTKCFVSNVECFAFTTRTCLTTMLHIFWVCFNNESLRSVMCRFNVGILTVFRWTCLDYTRFNNNYFRSFRINSFSVKIINIDILTMGRLSSILHGSRVIFDNGSLRSLKTWIWIGWFDWQLLDNLNSCPTSGRWACSEPNSLFHFVFQGDLCWRPCWHVSFSYMTSPVSILTTFAIQ